KHVFDDGVKIGGYASVFYERDSAFYDNGTDDSWWVEHPGDPMTPQVNQGTVSSATFFTSLFDVTHGRQLVKWAGLASVGLETERNAFGLTYLYTHTAEDVVTLAEDTRGKEYFFPGYDPTDPKGTGNEPEHLDDAPYHRLETLDYTER